MLRAESFNSLIKDLRQDMNIHSFIIYLEGIADVARADWTPFAAGKVLLTVRALTDKVWAFVGATFANISHVL